MDVHEPEQALQKQSAGDITRLPLVPAENKNGAIPHVQTREVRSRYRSPLPSSPTASKRCSSPTATKTPSTLTVSAAAKRAVSAERKRPSRPSSPRSPSTPVEDTIAESLLTSRKVTGNKLPPESLWPSTMRSLNVSFHSDTNSAPISKKEKPVTDRTLRQSLNGAHREVEVSRKPTPERKQSPLRGKSSAHQSENYKPDDRWPTAGRVSTASSRTVDLADKKIKVTSPSFRRLSLDGINPNKSTDLSNKTSKTSPSSQRASLDSTAILTRTIDLGDKTSKKLSSSCLDTGSPSLRRLSLDSTVGPNRNIDMADKTNKTSSLSTWGTSARSPRRLSPDGNAVLSRSINLLDKKSKTSLTSHSETGTPPFRRLTMDGGAVMSRSIDLADKKSRTPSSSNSGTDTSSIRRLSLPGNPVLNRSIDLTDKNSKTSSSYHSETGKPSPRIPSLGGTSKPFFKLPMHASSYESGRASGNECLVDDSSVQMARPDSSSSADGTARRLPSLGLLPVLSSVSRWISPIKAKAANASRGASPTRIRPSSPSRKTLSSTSVLSFIADIRHAKKNANHIEDVHNLRLLYNRLLQWRYANAQSDDALLAQKIKAEKVLCSVWMATTVLWDSIMVKRIEIHQMKLKLKLYSILDNQIFGLDEWASAETDHDNSLALAIKDLKASTVRVPVIGGARGDIRTIKAAVCSAVDVMQGLGSSLGSALLEVDRVNSLLTQLAYVAIQESALFDEYESILSSIAELQVKEFSLRSHLLQTKQGWSNEEISMFGY